MSYMSTDLRNQEIYDRMDAAADRARVALFPVLDSLSDEEAAGVKKFIRWYNNHYLKAGFVRLGRIIRDLPNRM